MVANDSERFDRASKQTASLYWLPQCVSGSLRRFSRHHIALLLILPLPTDFRCFIVPSVPYGLPSRRVTVDLFSFLFQIVGFVRIVSWVFLEDGTSKVR